jgi:hypothetical protein
LIFQIILAYTKFNGYEKPPVARSKLEAYYLQKIDFTLKMGGGVRIALTFLDA